MMRLQTSRPRWSVPSQWSPDGCSNLIEGLIRPGSNGARRCPKMARNTMKASHTRPRMTNGSWKKRRHDERRAATAAGAGASVATVRTVGSTVT